MIASLRGTVLSNSNGLVVLEVGGLGYAVSILSQRGKPINVGDELFLHTAFIVREDSHSLFGFQSADELFVFDLLRSVSGVGPKSALAVLSELTLSDIASAVALEDDSAFRRVSGIGPKTAKLITVSLAGKMNPQIRAAHGEGDLEDVDAVSNQGISDANSIAEAAAAVIEALLGLGYSEKVVAPVVREIAIDLKKANRNELLRAALGRLGTAKAVSGGESE